MTALFRPDTHRRTPLVTVLDNRGLTVRDIAYHRHPASPELTEERITRYRYDARGHLTQSADPRLHDTGRTNFTYLTDLAGSALRTVSVDAGTSISLKDAAGRPFISVSNIRTADDGTEDRSRAVTRTWQYENTSLPGRLLAVTEQTPDGASRITDRFVYAGSTEAEKALNLAGQCVSHYDTAGLIQSDSVALTGVLFSATRRLLKDADNPDVVADWQEEDVSAWNDLLDSETHTTLTTADATGTVLTTMDAKGNLQRVVYDVAGQLSASRLTLKGGKEQAIVRSLTYSAAGQKLREEHGNGVVTTYTYEPETQRLTGIKTERPAGHAAGAKVLQDLHYEYDPVGNVLKISNGAEKSRFWRNQKVMPENTCTYDSLYQLVSATGREMAGTGQQGCSLPPATVPLPGDSSAYTNYTRTYTYDKAGNLIQIRHSAPATNNCYTTDITVSDRSNRGVLSSLTKNPSDVNALFTAGGQQTQMQPGQSLIWTVRNELLKVTPVVRDGDAADHEGYRYGAHSQRILKMSVQKTKTSTQALRVMYLPGLELRTKKAGEMDTESLQVIAVGEAGRAQVRVLHWESGGPDAIDNDQLRWSYSNLTGSSGLEADGDGNVISMEEYYPYGGTAAWTARSQTEVAYKTVRYSGKELDATGLYYYGYRYYQPWAGRWLSADPAGTIDGLNLFRMVGNNPMTLCDLKGLAPPKQLSDKKRKFVAAAGLKLARLSSDSKDHFDVFKNQIREFMKEEHSSIKEKRFDKLWLLSVSEAYKIIENEKNLTLANRKIELGRGGDAIVYDMEDGYVMKEFHHAITDINKKEKEVSIFNKIYGVGSASILSNTRIKMKKITGTPISKIGVSSFTETDAEKLIGTLNDLHDKKVYHGDLHYENILFDINSRNFSIIDFGSSRIEENQEILENEMEEFKMKFIYNWPGFKRKSEPSVIGKDGRIYI